MYDPFSGSGTVPLEACLNGRHGIGSDLSPLAVVLTRGKIAFPGEAELDERERWVVAPRRAHAWARRVTLTLPVLNAARDAGRIDDPVARELVGEGHMLELVGHAVEQRLAEGIASGKLSDQASAIGKLYHALVGVRRFKEVVDKYSPGVVQRCLEKNRAERFQSARDLAFALRAIGTSTALSFEAPAERRKRKLIWGSVALAAMLFITLRDLSSRLLPPEVPTMESP